MLIIEHEFAHLKKYNAIMGDLQIDQSNFKLHTYR